MKLRILLTLAFLSLISIVGKSQLLWKIDGKDAKSPSYIFGTHHLAPISILDEVAGLKESIDAAKLFYGEINIFEIDANALQQKILSRVYLPEDSTWEVLFSPKELEAIDAVTNRIMGMPAQQFSKVSPSFLSSQLQVLASQKILPQYNPMQQLDAELLSRGKNAGKEIRGLESADYQLNLLYGAPYSLQAKEFVEDLVNGDFEKELKDLTDAYLKKDFNALAEQFDTENASETKRNALERLMNDRNRNWMKILSEQIPDGGIFIVVGAGHLVGKEGLLQNFRNLGYTVTPVE